MRLLAALLVLGAAAIAVPAPAQEPANGGTSSADTSSPQADPAPGGVDGMWCGAGLLRDYSLRLTQRQQDVAGELARPGRTRTIEGRIEGNVLRTQATKVGALVLERQGDELKITGGDGPIALARGQVFRRTGSGTCTG